MNKTTYCIAALLLIIGILAGALVTSARSTEWAGTKWEYAQIHNTIAGVVMIFTPDIGEQFELESIYKALPTNKQGANELLQIAGANGWELVTIVSGDVITSYYLKREIPL